MAKILLTEDDDAVRQFVSRALELDRHKVIAAVDGEDGYDRLQEHEGEFDLLLTDIMMPFMDGIALSKLAAQSFPDLKILMMTGFADQRERALELEGTVVDVVAKPFTLAQIRSAVSKALIIVGCHEMKKAS